MAKKVKLNLDDLNLEKGIVTKEDVIKIRDANFGKTSKLPSVIARSMADQMFKDVGSGTFINVKSMDADRKKLVINTFKKDFSRIAKATKRTDLRIRSVDQGDRVMFFYESKKAKEEEKAKAKAAAGGKK